MIRKTLMAAMVFAAGAMPALADVHRPTYHYHALSYPEWLAAKAGLSKGLVLGSLAVACIILNYIRVRRKSGATLLRFLCKQWISNLMICVLCLAGWFVLMFVKGGFEDALMGDEWELRKMPVGGGRVDILVGPNPNEFYFQYIERTRRLEKDLCVKCGTPMEHWYDMGRHSACPKCSGGRKGISHHDNVERF